MYEIWIDNEDPTRHLVLKSGAAKPQFFESRLWSRIGEVKAVDKTLAAEIEATGHSTVHRIGVAFDPDEEFG